MSVTLVQARDLARIYRIGDQTIAAVAAASCAIDAGQRIALFGPSGSGKSTLLQLLGALDEPTAGEISWPGLGSKENLRPSQISFVFQNESLLAPLTVVENVELPLLLQNSSPRKAREVARDFLERLGLAALGEKLPEEISGGQAQRVAFARALAAQPKLILADEPTGQLDRVTADQLLDVVLAAVDQLRAAMILATHDRHIGGLMDIHWEMDHGTLRAAA